MGEVTVGTDDVLVLRDIGVRFGGLTALDRVSLRVPPAGVVGVIGPNGAGKTTLFNVVCGFVRPDSGTMTFRGSPLRPRPHRLAGLGIARTLQGLGLFEGLTVAENVMIGATRSARAGFLPGLLALPGSDRDERRLRDAALAHLDALGIAGYAGARPSTLPYAVRKRVALARALATRPRLLLLDEPAGGLGAEEVDELARLIRALPARGTAAGDAPARGIAAHGMAAADAPARGIAAAGGDGCAVLLVEHHMDLVMAVCDQIVVLDFGRVVAAGTPDEIRADPVVAEAYLGTAVDAEPETESGADRAGAVS